MRSLKAGGLYFALVFGAGFLLGVVRQLLVAPRIGEMWAELLEMPLMFVVVVFAARWTLCKLEAPSRAGMGLVALGLLAVAELGLVVGLRGMTLSGYIASREPVSGVAYLLMLLLFAAMPTLLGSLQWSRHGPGVSRTAQTGNRE